MIAPLRTSKKRPAPRQLRAARAMIAAMFLPNAAPAPRIAAWKAWLFIIWISVTLLAYGFSVVGSVLSVPVAR